MTNATSNPTVDEIEHGHAVDITSFDAPVAARGPGNAPHRHWRDLNPNAFSKQDRDKTTILFAGLTRLHDNFIQAGLSSLGYRIEAMACPDNDALRHGKEFGNRGQCNPTYFTVGNLIKHLNRLRDEQGLSPEHIIEHYICVTANSCGPCRFGMYLTEYRKALRDAGYEGFRVLFLQQDLSDVADQPRQSGIEINRRFILTIAKSVIAGDVLNAIGYRMRPYEIEAGATDRALEECVAIVRDALTRRKSIYLALRRCRRVLKRVPLDRLRAKPKVSIIGEFWAMTTEGDGNYRLQRFLEKEGAECSVQLLSNWLLYLIWEVRYDLQEKLALRTRKMPAVADPASLAHIRGASRKTLYASKALELGLRTAFQCFARATGLRGYELPDMDYLAKLAHSHYYNELRGGEGHLEVAKLIYSANHNHANLVISVKPFGCMPSSGVSDGVQSLIGGLYPQAHFLAIETSGDGAVNVYSRVQMALFKAREKSQLEFTQALQDSGLDEAQAAEQLGRRARFRDATYYPAHRVASTAANTIYSLR